MEKRNQILEYLKNEHTGTENAVVSRVMEEEFGLKRRALQRRIATLRRNGYPICSGSNGYYYARDDEEVRAMLCRLASHIAAVSNTQSGMLFASTIKDVGTGGEIHIHLR